jgi:hypothetical protein
MNFLRTFTFWFLVASLSLIIVHTQISYAGQIALESNTAETAITPKAVEKDLNADHDSLHEKRLRQKAYQEHVQMNEVLSCLKNVTKGNIHPCEQPVKKVEVVH